MPPSSQFCEAYFVFAVGNLSALWKVEYKNCWKGIGCPIKLSDSITYTQVCGIIFGQLVSVVRVRHAHGRFVSHCPLACSPCPCQFFQIHCFHHLCVCPCLQFLGFFADRIGRKWGSVTTAATMVVGELQSHLSHDALTGRA